MTDQGVVRTSSRRTRVDSAQSATEAEDYDVQGTGDAAYGVEADGETTGSPAASHSTPPVTGAVSLASISAQSTTVPAVVESYERMARTGQGAGQGVGQGAGQDTESTRAGPTLTSRRVTPRMSTVSATGPAKAAAAAEEASGRPMQRRDEREPTGTPVAAGESKRDATTRGMDDRAMMVRKIKELADLPNRRKYVKEQLDASFAKALPGMSKEELYNTHAVVDAIPTIELLEMMLTNLPRLIAPDDAELREAVQNILNSSALEGVFGQLSTIMRTQIAPILHQKPEAATAVRMLSNLVMDRAERGSEDGDTSE